MNGSRDVENVRVVYESRPTPKRPPPAASGIRRHVIWGAGLVAALFITTLPLGAARC